MKKRLRVAIFVSGWATLAFLAIPALAAAHHPDGALTYPDAAQHIRMTPTWTATPESFPLISTEAVARTEHSLITALAVSPDGHFAATGHEDRSIRLWDLENGTLLDVIQGPQVRQSSGLPGGRYVVMDLAFSPDGLRLAASYGHVGAVWMIDLQDRQVQSRLGESLYYEALDWSPDGSLFAVAGETGVYPLTSFRLQIWDGGAQILLHEILLPYSAEPAIVWSPDGSYLLHANAIDAVIRDTRTWEVVVTLRGHERPLERASWSPDGRLIATTDNETVRVWDAQTGTQLAMFATMGENVWIPRVTWLPTGDTVVSVRGSVIQAWDIESAQEVFWFQAEAGVGGLGRLPDGNLLYATDTIYLLRIPTALD